MSLIDEALKRARIETARQDEAQRRATVPWVPTMAPARRRRPWVPAVLAGSIVAVLGIGLWLVLFQDEAPEPAPAPAGPVAVEAAPAPPRAAPSQPVLVEEEPPPPALEAPPVRTVPAPLPEAAAPPPAVAEPRPAAPPQPAPPARVEPAPAPAREVPAPPAAAPSTPSAAAPAADPNAPAYLREADLPGGKRLSLTGIAYSAQPIAVINGTVVGPGEIVEGYTVEKIEPDRVELRSDAGTLVLLLRQRQ